MQIVSRQPFYFEGNRDKFAVVLFHSFSSNPVDMIGIGRSLAKDGYTVYAPMLTGHGQSLDKVLIKPEIWLDDGRKAIEFMNEKGHKTVTCFGLSLGGLISFKMLMESNQVLGGGSICSPLLPGYVSNTAKDFWQRYVHEKRKIGWSENQILESQQEIDQKISGLLQGLEEIKEAMYPQWGKISKPVLIAQGGDDPVIDPQQAVEVRNLLVNSLVQFHWFEDGGHQLSVGKYRKPLYEVMADYLSTLDDSL